MHIQYSTPFSDSRVFTFLEVQPKMLIQGIQKRLTGTSVWYQRGNGCVCKPTKCCTGILFHILYFGDPAHLIKVMQFRWEASSVSEQGWRRCNILCCMENSHSDQFIICIWPKNKPRLALSYSGKWTVTNMRTWRHILYFINIIALCLFDHRISSKFHHLGELRLHFTEPDLLWRWLMAIS